ncbi:c-type cytochrome [Shewanella gelidimarina]|uniref:c-type cytochrome n=1 Tax=Shewanella gelidimarina TaxID=56813 RepID=UPI00200EE897|nr:c-type cytochrome [Shewanella gelidimarina]MCL1057369.1 c-type cytochrome [Shewanella gelidimarina]
MKRGLIACALLVLSASSYAAMPPSAALCGSCHGSQGQGVDPLGPRLAGLSSDYIAKQIKLFQTGKRQNATMQPMSMTLQGDAVYAVADYFSSFDVPIVTPHLRGEKAVYEDPTEQLVYQGDWQRVIPACVTCHGPSGLGVGEFPRLAGQQASYIKNQLMAWQKDTRSGDQDGVMGAIADKLTSAEIDALSKYFAELK